MNTIDWKTLLVSAEGRLARQTFWIVGGFLILTLMVYESLGGLTWRLLTGWMIYPLLIFFGACVLSKRLHDRGRSGWYAAPIILSLIGVMGPWNAVDLIFLAVLIWAFVELALLTGEQGANRYGLNPVRQPA